MSLGKQQEKFSEDLVRLIMHAFDLGYKVRIGEVQRTEEQQNLYIQSGRSKTTNSMHLKKCAADLHFTDNGHLVYPQELGQFWEALSPENQWGGFWENFVDRPHFERRI